MEIAWSFVHGYWGCPEDYDPLISAILNSEKKISHSKLDQLGCNSDSLSQQLEFKHSFFKQNLLDKSNFKHSVLSFANYRTQALEADLKVYVGYSLGGRLLSNYFLANKVSLAQNEILILVSSGCGIDKEEEKKSRALWENKTLEKIKNSSVPEFFEEWANYGIFSDSLKRQTIPDWSKRDLLAYFDFFRLSNQKYLKTEIQENQNVFLVLGEKDLKYQAIYEGSDYDIIAGAGHRVVLDKPNELADLLLEIVKRKVPNDH